MSNIGNIKDELETLYENRYDKELNQIDNKLLEVYQNSNNETKKEIKETVIMNNIKKLNRDIKMYEGSINTLDRLSKIFSINMNNLGTLDEKLRSDLKNIMIAKFDKSTIHTELPLIKYIAYNSWRKSNSKKIEPYTDEIIDQKNYTQYLNLLVAYLIDANLKGKIDFSLFLNEFDYKSYENRMKPKLNFPKITDGQQKKKKKKKKKRGGKRDRREQGVKNRGKQGDRGDRGDRGVRGDRGDRGDRGKQKNRGDRGNQRDRGSKSQRNIYENYKQIYIPDKGGTLDNVIQREFNNTKYTKCLEFEGPEFFKLTEGYYEEIYESNNALPDGKVISVPPPASAPASGTASATASAPASGTASAPASAPASGTASATASAPVSAPASGTASATASAPASATAPAPASATKGKNIESYQLKESAPPKKYNFPIKIFTDFDINLNKIENNINNKLKKEYLKKTVEKNMKFSLQNFGNFLIPNTVILKYNKDTETEIKSLDPQYKQAVCGGIYLKIFSTPKFLNYKIFAYEKQGDDKFNFIKLRRYFINYLKENFKLKVKYLKKLIKHYGRIFSINVNNVLMNKNINKEKEDILKLAESVLSNIEFKIYKQGDNMSKDRLKYWKNARNTLIKEIEKLN